MSPKTTKRTVLFVPVEASQHERLRTIAFEDHRSMADVVRQAVTEFIARRDAEAIPDDNDPIHGLVGATRLGVSDASDDVQGDALLYGAGPSAPAKGKKRTRRRPAAP